MTPSVNFWPVPAGCGALHDPDRQADAVQLLQMGPQPGGLCWVFGQETLDAQNPLGIEPFEGQEQQVLEAALRGRLGLVRAG